RYLGLHSARLSEVTTKRGLAPSLVTSALPMTRRSRLQLRRVRYLNSLKYRAGLSVRRLFASARSSSLAIAATRRSFFCRPNRKWTPFASHQPSTPPAQSPSRRERECAR